MGRPKRAVVAEALPVVVEEIEEVGEVGEVGGPFIDGPEPGTVPAKNPALAPGVGSFFLGLARSMSATYGSLALKSMIKSAERAVTTAEDLRKRDGSAYAGKEKFSIATQMLKQDAIKLGKDIALDAAQTLVQLMVSKLFGKGNLY